MKPLLPAVFLLLLCSTLCAGEKLRRVTMEDIMQRLWEDGIPVCFEEVMDKQSAPITWKKKVEWIEAIPEDQRTPEESSRLRDAKSILVQGIVKPDNTYEYTLKRFDVDFPDAPVKPAAILDAAVKADPEYQWKEIDGKYVVFPKEHSFNLPVAAFEAKDLDKAKFDEVIAKLLVEPAKLDWVTISERFVSIGEDDGPVEINDPRYAHFTLSVKNTDTRTALTMAANKMAPNEYWVATAWGELRIFSFIAAQK